MIRTPSKSPSLKVQRQTLRVLVPNDLESVAGGGHPTLITRPLTSKSICTLNQADND